MTGSPAISVADDLRAWWLAVFLDCADCTRRTRSTSDGTAVVVARLCDPHRYSMPDVLRRKPCACCSAVNELPAAVYAPLALLEQARLGNREPLAQVVSLSGGSSR